MTIDEILAALQAIIDSAGDRELNEDEVQRYEQLEVQLRAAQKDVEIRSRQAAYVTPTNGGVQVNANESEQDEQSRAFEHYLRTGQANSELVELRAQGEGVSSQGGYLVPTGFRDKIIERMKAYGGIASKAEVISTTSGNPIEWPTVDDTGNVAEIVAEHGTFAAGADVVYGTKQLGAHKYMAGGAGNTALKVSVELLQDSAFDIESHLAKLLGTRISRVQAIHIATGSGSGEPQGLVTPLTTIGAIANNTTGPTYAELLATVHALDPEYRASAVWVMNDASLAKVQGLLDSAGRPLWLDNAVSGMRELPGGRLLGYEVVIDQSMPAMASSGKFLAFGDLGMAYVVRRVKDIQLVVLHEKYIESGQVGFMAWARMDSCVQDANAVVVRTAA
jgi:HK97 family phage major capsid protein